MATEFTTTIKSSGGDYTTLNAAQLGIACDLTAATTMVFGVSTVTGTPGASLTGQTSGATATLVKVNVAKTQALLKSIAGGPFVVGETVQSSVGNSFVLTNAGDSAIAGFQCYGMQDTTKVATSASWVCSATNYVHIYAAPGAQKQMPYDTSGVAYRLEPTAALNMVPFNIQTASFVCLVENIQIKTPSWSASSFDPAFYVNAASASATLVGCYILGAMNAGNTAVVLGVDANAGSSVLVVNCVIDGFTDTGNTGNIAVRAAINTTVYATTIYNSAVGVSRAAGTCTCKNVLYSRAALSNHVGFSGTIGGTNNASTEADAPGTNPYNSATFTFVNAAGGDYHLASTDTGALRLGADLRTDATYPVATDFDGKVRYGTPSIGAFDVYGPAQRTPNRSPASPKFRRI